MTLNPDEDALSEWECDILRGLEKDLAWSDPEFVAAFHWPDDLVPRPLAGALPAAVGVAVALAALSVSLAVTVAGLTTILLGIGLAVATR
ncbi:MAG TPA: DUF3040 domain-containing protein [Acidimicrobiia bacterium]|jgi:hypothetical protein